MSTFSMYHYFNIIRVSYIFIGDFALRASLRKSKHFEVLIVKLYIAILCILLVIVL